MTNEEIKWAFAELRKSANLVRYVKEKFPTSELNDKVKEALATEEEFIAEYTEILAYKLLEIITWIDYPTAVEALQGYPNLIEQLLLDKNKTKN